MHSKLDVFLDRAVVEHREGISSEVMKHLVFTYGSDYREIVHLVREDRSLGRRICPTSPVIAAEVTHALRHEMAQTLSDVIYRRTELGIGGLPNEDGIDRCAQIMGRELNWDRTQKRQEIDSLYQDQLVSN